MFLKFMRHLLEVLDKMVKKSSKNNKTYYICQECNFAYKDKETAAKCEAWCREHHSCNVEITKHAVNI